jgi:biotin carboxyl carrier protein
MKLTGRISDNEYRIDVREAEGRVIAEIDGRTYDLEISETEPGVFLFKSGGRIFEAAVSPGDDGESKVRIRDAEFSVGITDPKRLRGSAGADHSHDGRAEIRTAMPGKVVRILVETGAEVRKDDGILVVEAMKMQNELKTPKDGTVKEIRATEGSTVNAGEVLAVIE